MSISYPVFQFHDTGEGMELHPGRMLNGLHHLVHAIIGTGPVQDPHAEQAEENQIINISLIYLSKPFHPLDHIGLQSIIKEKVWEDIPLPTVVNNCLVIRFILLDYSVEGILGNLYALH